MAEIPFGPYEPDIHSVGTSKSSYVKNVVPLPDGYGPLGSVLPFTQAMSGYCRGVTGTVQSDGSCAVFGGNDTKLYKLNGTTRVWDDVTRTSGGNYNLTAREMWDFCQFGNQLIATTNNNNPQLYTLGSSSNFADLTGSPPQARRCAVVGDFVVLSSLTANPNRVHWSGFNDVTSWTPGTNQSDYQEFPDGGFVQGVSGGEFGIIFQERAIRRMIYTGPPNIFEFQRISDNKGCLMRYSICKSGSMTFFMSTDGFYKIDLSGQITPIGANRINLTMLADIDTTDHRNIVGATDPNNTRVLWFYKSYSSAVANTLNKVLIYDWSLDRFSYGEINTIAATPMLQLSSTLDGLDTLVYNSSTVTLTIASPCVVTWASHGIPNGYGVQITTTGTLPTGLTAGTTYYVINATTNTFQLSATKGGSAINTSGSQSGTHTAKQLDGLDRLPFSLDNYDYNYLQQLGVVSSAGQMGYLNGPYLEAILDTPEGAIGNGVRTFVQNVAPVGDSSSAVFSVRSRDRLIDTITTGSESSIGVRGYAAVRANARYNTVRARIPAGSSWSYIRSVDVTSKPSGLR